MKLPDQAAIVTGGGQGIGKAIALKLAREGADVLVSGRHRETLENTAREIEKLGRRSVVAVTDVSQEPQVSAMVEAALQNFGRIDILVNNAGVTGPTAPITNVSRDEWDHVFAVNLTGAFLCAKAVIPHMIQRRSGKIINISSIAGKLAYALRSPYAASKWGMIGLSRTLAQELGPHNIQVNAICPGPTAGERMRGVIAGRARELDQSEAEVERLYVESTALKRMVDPDHVAAMVVLLVSNEGSSITGEAIDVSAGYAL
jgi:meso-butanediol dehydrogenase / (S,S)-butanediol dehydrogenase / diacetyl reductase